MSDEVTPRDIAVGLINALDECETGGDRIHYLETFLREFRRAPSAEIKALQKALGMMWDKYEDGTTCFEMDEGGNFEDHGAPLGNAVSLSFEEEELVRVLVGREAKADAQAKP